MFSKIKTILARRTPQQADIQQRLRKLMISLNLRGSAQETANDVRRLALMVGKVAGSPVKFAQAMAGLAEAQARHDAETSSWLTPEQIAAGKSGPFESCNLLSWLELAKKAGVAAVPATVILRLSDAESEAASGTIAMPTGAVPDRIRQRVKNALAANGDLTAALAEAPAPTDAPVDMEMLVEKLHACMDDLPANVMVRTTQCGASTLKSLAGTGTIDPTAPEVQFDHNLEIGPGWVRMGNRRRVDVQDKRLLDGYVEGPHTGMVFIARPWITSSRHIEGRDPHRAGTPFDVPGVWPAEWRAFVKQGQVIGVASYYGWCDSATPETARTATEVRVLAQRIVDVALAQDLKPRYQRVDAARGHAPTAEMLVEKGFGPDDFAATIDFIETDKGILMLEAGPGMTPLGGGHPCAFAGVSGPPTPGNPTETVGVAFRVMDHVLIGEPSTWVDGDRTDRVLTWDEVAVLAAQDTDPAA